MGTERKSPQPTAHTHSLSMPPTHCPPTAHPPTVHPTHCPPYSVSTPPTAHPTHCPPHPLSAPPRVPSLPTHSLPTPRPLPTPHTLRNDFPLSQLPTSPVPCVSGCTSLHCRSPMASTTPGTLGTHRTPPIPTGPLTILVCFLSSSPRSLRVTRTLACLAPCGKLSVLEIPGRTEAPCGRPCPSGAASRGLPSAERELRREGRSRRDTRGGSRSRQRGRWGLRPGERLSREVSLVEGTH